MYRDNGELCFSLRSVNQYMQWFKGNIHIVTNTPPEWLNTDHPRIKVVPEKQIMERKNLPTFNSMALESNLHKIHGLKPHYLYFNDDFMFGRNVSLDDFYDTRDQCYQFYHLPVSLDKVKVCYIIIFLLCDAMNTNNMILMIIDVKPPSICIT
jgi:hypothetical protein